MKFKAPKPRPLAIDLVREFYYPTTDNWAPNFPRDTVRVALYMYPPSLDRDRKKVVHFKLVVSGADDTMVARYSQVPVSEASAERKALTKWLDLRLPNPLTLAWLLSQGFTRE